MNSHRLLRLGTLLYLLVIVCVLFITPSSGENPTITYGDGWTHYTYSDGHQEHKIAPTNYLRWDGEWRPKSEVNFSTDNWPYLVEDLGTYYLITRLDDSLNLSKNYRTYDFQPHKIGVHLTLTPVQLNGMSTYHNAGGIDYWYIKIPQSIKQTAKHLNWDNKLPTISNESGTSLNQSDNVSGEWLPNYKYQNVGDELRLYYNQVARNFGITSTEIVFDFNSYIINGSSGWQNTSFDNTTTKINNSNTVIVLDGRLIDDGDVIHLWHFNEGSGTSCVNEIIGSHNLIVPSAIWGLQNTIFGDSDLYCNGTHSAYKNEVVVPNIPNNGTIELWMMPDIEINSSTGEERLLDWNYVNIDFIASDGRIKGAVHDGVAFRESFSSQTVWNANQIYKIDLSWGASGNVTLSVNNVSQTPDTNYDGSVGSAANTIGIGGERATTGTKVFNGTIGDARISNIERTSISMYPTSGNVTHWHDAGAGYQTASFIINMTTPTNTNYTVWYANNGSSFTQIGGVYTGNQTPSISGTKYQNTDLRIIMNGNTTATPEEMEVAFVTETVGAPPVVTLLSQTPSTICKNCTGNISIEYGISHSSPLNNTSISFIYRDYDHDLSDSNHSIRPPINNLASEWNYDGQILRGANRNESLNFENNATITGGDIYSWSGLDENNTEVNIVPINSTYTKVYINSTIHRVMPQMHYIDRTDMQEAPKTQIGIHKTQNVLVKFWNFEIFKGNTDFLGAGYTDTALDSNPALHPSDANPVSVYYISSGYDPSTGGDPLTSGFAVYMLSLNASKWTDHDYSPHANSSYVRGFINNNLLELYINTTNISYLYYTSNTPSSKSFYINVTDVATNTNVSFANTSVLWAGDTILSQQSYTPNIWFAFMKANLSFDHKLYVADNNDQWANSTMNRTTIEEALFPPTKSTFHSFHNGFTDYDMNGTYSGTFFVRIGAGSDPDGGNTTQNVSLHYGNGTYISTLANTTCTPDCLFMNVSFNSTPYYSTEYNYTMRVVGTDDEGDTATTWLNVNFSLQDNIYIVSGSVYDEYNKGLSSATITLDSDTTTTASDGTFIFTGIADGTYKLSTFKDPYGTLSTTISVSGAHVTGQDFYYTDKTGGGAGATGPIQIVDVLDVDGEIIGKAIAIGKLGEAWFTIDLISISNLLSGKDTKNVWNILAIFSIFLVIIGFFDKSKTAKGEFLLVIGLIGLLLFSINRFDIINTDRQFNSVINIWNGVIILSTLAFIYGFFFDKSKTPRSEFLTVIGFVGMGLYAIYQSKLAIVIGLG